MKKSILLESLSVTPPTISPEEICLSRSNASYSEFTVIFYFESLIISNDFWLPPHTIHHLTSENQLLALLFLQTLQQPTSPSSFGSFIILASDNTILPRITGSLFIWKMDWIFDSWNQGFHSS